MKLRLLLVTLLISAFGFSAKAETLSYNFLQAGYQFSDFDTLGDEGNGVSLDLSFSIAGPVFVEVGADWSSLDSLGDAFGLNVGIGGYVPLSSRLHLVGSVGFTYSEFDTDTFGSAKDSLDDGGLYVGPALRYAVTDHIEVFGRAHYTRIDDEDSVTFGIGGVINVTNNIGLVGNIDFEDEANSYGLGIRFSW